MKKRSNLILHRWLLIAGIMVLIAVIATCKGEQPANAMVTPDKGTVAPDFTLTTLDGKNVSLSDYRGQVVFLNFWATWCPPCRGEMPAMENLHRLMKGYDFVILAVSIDKKSTYHVKSFVESKGYSFSIMHDVTKEVARNYVVGGIPTTFIIDKNGIISNRLVGSRQWDSASVVNYFKKISK
jgi:peroxiredoxin